MELGYKLSTNLDRLKEQRESLGEARRVAVIFRFLRNNRKQVQKTV